MSHGEALRLYSDDPELASHVMHDYREADLDEPTRGMLDFAVKLTRDPSSVQQEDVEGLRRQGLDDQQVLSVVLITSLFNFMTRLADGLGVEFPATRQRHIESWLAGPASQQKWMMTGKG
jgi:uncharacterized peroxidase-related enzyme